MVDPHSVVGALLFLFASALPTGHAADGAKPVPSSIARACKENFESRIQEKIEVLKTLLAGKALNLIGGPGAGKGTLAALLAEFGMSHLSIGELFRAEYDAGTDDGINAKKYTDAGVLVPDDIYDRVVRRGLAKIALDPVLVLDGSTRNMVNKNMIEKMLADRGTPIGAVIFLNVPEPELIERALSRRNCSNDACKAIYSIRHDHFANEGHCNKCGASLRIRKDDNIESINERLDTFRTQTLPVIEQFKAEGKLLQIDVMPGETPEQIAERSIDAVIAYLLNGTSH